MIKSKEEKGFEKAQKDFEKSLIGFGVKLKQFGKDLNEHEIKTKKYFDEMENELRKLLRMI